MKIVKYIIFIGVLALYSCRLSPEMMTPFLEGYWEIVEVKKDGKIIKEFTLNTQVDYFEVNDDLSGYRKKVSPTLDGSYLVTQHQTPFKLISADNELQIHYSDNAIEYIETIIKLNENTLIIKNKEGLVYRYRPFESLKIN